MHKTIALIAQKITVTDTSFAATIKNILNITKAVVTDQIARSMEFCLTGETIARHTKELSDLGSLLMGLNRVHPNIAIGIDVIEVESDDPATKLFLGCIAGSGLPSFLASYKDSAQIKQIKFNVRFNYLPALRSSIR